MELKKRNVIYQIPVRERKKKKNQQDRNRAQVIDVPSWTRPYWQAWNRGKRLGKEEKSLKHYNPAIPCKQFARGSWVPDSLPTYLPPIGLVDTQLMYLRYLSVLLGPSTVRRVRYLDRHSSSAYSIKQLAPSNGYLYLLMVQDSSVNSIHLFSGYM